MQVYQPAWFSFKKPNVIIQPVGALEKEKETLEFVGKITAGFSSPIKSIKSTYDYQKEAMQTICLTKRLAELSKETKGKYTMVIAARERTNRERSNGNTRGVGTGGY